MKIKYAVVSSNNDPTYLDFWPYVAKAWKRIGIEPVLLFIDQERPSQEIENHGRVFYLNSLPDWSIVQQAQSIRFWAAKLLDDVFIISDMDMLPISEEYYQNGVKDVNSGIVSYSSDVIQYRWYKKNPQYPMCHLAGEPNTFIEMLEMEPHNTHEDFLRRLKSLSIPFGTDQVFFYTKAIRKQDKMTHLSRGWIEERYAVKRLDKVIWPNPGYIAEEYIDCHLPRPYNSNKEMCDELFTKLGII